MKVKLTLTLDESVIERAKIYAKDKGRSLSDIVENYLNAITSFQRTREVDTTPIVSSLKGSFRTAEDFDYRREQEG
jgi:hypothetical protein